MKANLKYRAIVLLWVGSLLMIMHSSRIWYDDAGHWHVARTIVEGKGYCYQLNSLTGDCDPYSPYITMGPIATYLGAGWMSVFGTDMTVLRLLPFLVNLLFIGVFWALARSMLGEKKAFWAAMMVAWNIQMLVYGTQFLGEPFMLLFLFLGLFFLEKWRLGGKRGYSWIFLTLLAWLLAIECKEYLVVPLGLSLLLVAVNRAWQKRWKDLKAFLVLGGGILLGMGLIYVWRFGSFEGVGEYFRVRESYGAEFFTLAPGQALKYILFKPLIVLGTIAVAVRWYFRREEQAGFLLILQSFLLLFFLLSAGYDRLGYLLLFIPAIYLSEYWLAWWQKPRTWAKGASKGVLVRIIVFLVIFAQLSVWRFAYRLSYTDNYQNQFEFMCIRELEESGCPRIFTYDQQILPFLPEGIDYRLCPQVPSNAQNCEALELSPNEFFYISEYGISTYYECWEHLQKARMIYRCGASWGLSRPH